MANPTIEIVPLTSGDQDQLSDIGMSPVIPVATNSQPVSGEEELLAGARAVIAKAIREKPSTPTLADHGFD